MQIEFIGWFLPGRPDWREDLKPSHGINIAESDGFLYRRIGIFAVFNFTSRISRCSQFFQINIELINISVDCHSGN